MTSSVALGFNLAEPGVYTKLGQTEHDAKTAKDAAAIGALARACSSVISSLAFYEECSAICAVPPSPDKDWDLPTELANLVAAKTKRDDISTNIRFSKKKVSVKSLSLTDKWGALDAAKLKIDGDVKGKKIVLLDDRVTIRDDRTICCGEAI